MWAGAAEMGGTCFTEWRDGFGRFCGLGGSDNVRRPALCGGSAAKCEPGDETDEGVQLVHGRPHFRFEMTGGFCRCGEGAERMASRPYADQMPTKPVKCLEKAILDVARTKTAAQGPPFSVILGDDRFRWRCRAQRRWLLSRLRWGPCHPASPLCLACCSNRAKVRCFCNRRRADSSAFPDCHPGGRCLV